jgi:hypothetical protein
VLLLLLLLLLLLPLLLMLLLLAAAVEERRTWSQGSRKCEELVPNQKTSAHVEKLLRPLDLRLATCNSQSCDFGKLAS